MDPFSTEGELLNIHSAFHQGQFQSVLDYDTSQLSSSNQPRARILQLRAQIELGQTQDVLDELEQEGEQTPDLLAVRAFAHYVQDPESEAVWKETLKLTSQHGDDATVQVLCGTVLSNLGMKEEALSLLAKHTGSLDAVAVLVQVHLSQNRLDVAQAEVRKARKYAQDHLLVNLAESWVNLREGGEKYQTAFYVYEELATTPSTTSPRTLLGQAIAELHLGRTPEAEAALAQALEQNPEDADVLANAVVLNAILGKAGEAEEMKTRLRTVMPGHVLLRDLEAKRGAWEAAKGRYNPRFEVEA